jgi:adenylate cyclase
MPLLNFVAFDEVIIAAKKAQLQGLSYSASYRCLASAPAHLGRTAEAREAAARVLEADPDFRISAWIVRGGQSNSRPLIERASECGFARMSAPCRPTILSIKARSMTEFGT